MEETNEEEQLRISEAAMKLIKEEIVEEIKDSTHKLLIRSDKMGLQIELATASNTMSELISHANQIKKDFFETSNNKPKEYVN